jgi:hypothetical protein
MEIVEKTHLSVLMTALYVAKWESDDDNAYVKELAGSPFFSQLYHDVANAVIQFDAGKPPALRRWENWRAIEQRPIQLELTRARIKRISQWPGWSREQKRNYVLCLLSPFTATEDTLEALISL